jgi:Type II CAAX prenyl endopeptidase Rce1-like
MSGYFSATRHPWSCTLFVVPLLAAYEAGVLWLGGDQSGQLRNGADAWLRWGLELFGAVHPLAAPVTVVCVMLLWSWWRWSDRPKDPITTFFGIAFESCLFAFVLWQFSRNFLPILERLGVKLEITVQTAPVTEILKYVGAGIYEEVIFRLGLFLGLYCILRTVLMPRPLALLLAAFAAALGFAAAHHLGPYGEPMRADFFVFRTCAGLFFTLLFVTRGFGIAVGAHAGYDVLVGVVLG